MTYAMSFFNGTEYPAATDNVLCQHWLWTLSGHLVIFSAWLAFGDISFSSN
jgi:hypothetical protein